ncbi:MAG: hypothetical protein IV100_16010 [Myxococcales bacterium]|nr:hypothetical protein [Myxococcales bacterium]
MERVPGIIRQVYSLVRELEVQFPGRRFTPDGHLVGSIGEVLAAHRYGLELLTASAARHDAKAPDGRLVQIKATQGKSVAFRGAEAPDHLLVLKLNSDGTADEVYNGPGRLASDRAGGMASNGQRAVRLTILQGLMGSVSEADRLPVVAATQEERG